MNLSPNKPIVACYCIEDSLGILVVRRLWQGTIFLGLPGDIIPDSESIDNCAMRLLAPHDKNQSDIALVRSLGQFSHLGGSEEYEWDNQPVALNIFSFPQADVIAPMNNRATRISRESIMKGEDPSFDITLVLLRQEFIRQNLRVA